MNGKNGDQSMRKRQARPVSELAALVLEPVLARRTGMKLDLLAGWSAIVGPLHADYTRPEKIVWPRRMVEDDPFEPGQLVVACDGARAILFQHELGEVTQKVNMFFGFPAIARIRIVQKPLVQLAPRATLSEPKLDDAGNRKLARLLEGVEHDGLRQALSRLGRGVLSKSRPK